MHISAFIDILMASLVGLAVLLTCYFLNDLFSSLANKLPDDWKESLEKSGNYLFRNRLGFAEVFSLSMTLGLVVFGISLYANAPVIIGPLIAILIMGFPLVLAGAGEVRYRKSLEDVLPSALNQVANEMASGRSLEKALATVSETVQEPASSELAALQRKISALGMERALEDTSKRLNIKSFSLTAAVLKVGSKRGGNLISALKQLSTTLVEIERMNRKIRTASAAGRWVLLLLSCASVVFTFGWYTYGPQQFSQVIQHPVGQGMLVAAVLLWAIAMGIAVTVMRVKV